MEVAILDAIAEDESSSKEHQMSLFHCCSRSEIITREFTKPRRRRRGQHRVKNEFIFYLRISRYSKVIYFVYHCQNYLKTQCETQR